VAAEQYRVTHESLAAMHAHYANRTERRVEVAARLIAKGEMPFSQGLERVFVAERADQRRGLTPDPVHGIVRRPEGTTSSDAVERRVETLLGRAIDRYEARERQGSGMRA
jgi:hypothetical protein